MVRLIVCVTGMPGSGKTLVARCIAQELGLYVNMGDVVRAKASEAGLEPTAENLMKLAQELRRAHGPGVIAKEVARAISSYDGVVVVDGVRSLEEVKVFSTVAPTLVVAVHSSPRTRYSRLRVRGRSDDPGTYNEFQRRDMKELELGIGSVIALADVVIVNEGEELSSVCGEALKKVRRAMEDVAGQG